MKNALVYIARMSMIPAVVAATLVALKATGHLSWSWMEAISPLPAAWAALLLFEILFSAAMAVLFRERP